MLVIGNACLATGKRAALMLPTSNSGAASRYITPSVQPDEITHTRAAKAKKENVPRMAAKEPTLTRREATAKNRKIMMPAAGLPSAKQVSHPIKP